MDTHKTGTGMIVAACILGMFILTWFFGDVEKDQRNPNRDPDSLHFVDAVEVTLQRNRQGHYMVIGEINSQPVRSCDSVTEQRDACAGVKERQVDAVHKRVVIADVDFALHYVAWRIIDYSRIPDAAIAHDERGVRHVVYRVACSVHPDG